MRKKGVRMTISRIPCLLVVCGALLVGTSDGFGQELVGAFAFGPRDLTCETPNAPGTNYTTVLHRSPASVAYDSARGFGYEVLYPENSPYGDRGGYGVYGPFDASPNDRGKFGNDCPEKIYDSFIGAQIFLTACDPGTERGVDVVCSEPEGIIFRADVPNGQYQFVAVVGSADNPHAHRILAEDGGSGPPENIGNHVVLVEQFDQGENAQAFASLGFADKAPPPADGVTTVDQGESPVLNVTNGYIRIHQLQGNTNFNDPNGGNMVILELWRVGDVAVEVPGMTFGGAIIMMAIMACLGAFVLRRRRPAPATATN